ncbi:MAG TPA: hypothetical protein VGL09_19225 [Methylomirabilota bacterium]|jgi:hypothetical protein
MTALNRRSRLPTVAAAVGAALARHQIRAVLTGGACASLHTRGRYLSRDMDFILIGTTTQLRLDDALASVGFVRVRDRYVHPDVPFYVEFPRGPLAIGDDYRIRPLVRRYGRGRWLLLSATDSCRDRLAAFYHWNDHQSLRVAVEIALAQRVNLRVIRQWSAAEGFPDRLEEFLGEVRRRRRRGPLLRAGR